MKKTILYVIAGLLMGFGVGFSVSDILNRQDEQKGHSHSEKEKHNDMAHEHPSYEITGELIPSVDIEVTEDSKSGWNIKLTTKNFKFTPENVGKENVEGEGHAHLYLDDVKIARLYSNYYHYDGDFEGTKTFKVTLNANDHSEYTKDSEVIGSSTEITHQHE